MLKIMFILVMVMAVMINVVVAIMSAMTIL